MWNPHVSEFSFALSLKCSTRVSMARKPNHIRQMEDTLDQLDKKLAELQRDIQTIRAERDEVSTAHKVSMRLWLASISDSNDGGANEGNAPARALPEAKDLTVGQAALIILQEGDREGMTSGDILSAVRARFFPDLARTSLSPPLSRLKARNEIDLVGDRWKIVQKKEPPDNDLLGGSLEGDA